jgi:hypothetical protein
MTERGSVYGDGHPTFVIPAQAGIHLFGVGDGFPLSPFAKLGLCFGGHVAGMTEKGSAHRDGHPTFVIPAQAEIHLYRVGKDSRFSPWRS